MNIALVLAGGIGLRMKTERPKQFMPLLGKPVISHSLLSFQQHSLIDAMYIVCHKEWIDQMNVLFDPVYGFSKLKAVVSGGNSRRESSYLGLKEIANKYHKSDIVLIHDAARPNLSQKIITDNINAATKFGACVTAIPATDTMFISKDGKLIHGVPKRSAMFAAQTPQSFQLENILNAHEAVSQDEEVTDDAGLLLKLDLPVALVEGDKKNIKLTTEEDFFLLQKYMGL
ncbi:2-C-methyl-D-erythritol 4-phosphate cytidylyltransferase [Paludicola sp. MB14-C6]|uniref:2-C-methyl-D-erythritol 4-phosphate cytidylyltransferase n=1 Tax=Paludihabitans sp. MB14-C6 TaxID=3070656 RepID=UPI0027DCD705|nr:2-C-methyl-D-erythritol 4-phosphate cytidylyltransferase [Paludicola sp. MB14-C6]WMJ23883.1 2-C-methyl-D-erythritol 4-phosphate cytidylyltransferase [Paludicola sp. MB14-C6]